MTEGQSPGSDSTVTNDGWMLRVNVLDHKGNHIHMVEAPIDFLFDYKKDEFLTETGKMEHIKIFRWVFDFIEDEDEMSEHIQTYKKDMYFTTNHGMRLMTNFAWKNILKNINRYGNIEDQTLTIKLILCSKAILKVFIAAGFIFTKASKRKSTRSMKTKKSNEYEKQQSEAKIWKHDGKEYPIKISEDNDNRKSKAFKERGEDAPFVTKARGDGRYSYDIPKTPHMKEERKYDTPSDEDKSSIEDSSADNENTSSEDGSIYKDTDNDSTSTNSRETKHMKKNRGHHVSNRVKGTPPMGAHDRYSTKALLHDGKVYTISPKHFSLKTWDKIDSLPIPSRNLPISHWYGLICNFCRGRHLYIPPYSTLTRETAPMGLLWGEVRKNMIEEKVEHFEEDWSNTLFRLLTKKDFFPTSGPMANWNNIALESFGNGYLALYRMIQQHHPILRTEMRKVIAPSQGRMESMSSYINRMKDYFLLEAIDKRYYYGRRIVEILISNAKEEYKPVLTQHMEKHMPYESSRYIPDYKLDLIAITFENELTRMGYITYSDNRQGMKPMYNERERIMRTNQGERNIIRLIEDECFEIIETGTIHALATNEGECPICFSRGHTADMCFKLADWCRSQAFLTKNPRYQEKMALVRPIPRVDRNKNYGKKGPPRQIHAVDMEDRSVMNDTKENIEENQKDEGTDRSDIEDYIDDAPKLNCIDMPLENEQAEASHDYISIMEGTFVTDIQNHEETPTDMCHEINPNTEVKTMAHIDDGSSLNAVCKKELLFGYKEFDKPRIIGQDAQGTKIYAYGDGYARYIAEGPNEGYHDTHSYFAPGLTTNFLSVNRLETDINGPRSLNDKNRMSYVKKNWSSGTGYAFVKHKSSHLRDLKIPGTLLRGHVYAILIPPGYEEHTSPYNNTILHEILSTVPIGSLPVLHTLSTKALKILWHHRLNHMSGKRLKNLYRFGKNIPKLDFTDIIDNCPICMAAKMKRSNRNTNLSMNPLSKVTVAFQGISIDMGFIVQTSSTNPDRKRYLEGINGETCYTLIRDHYSGMIMGQCQSSKGADIDYLSKWIATHAPPISGKFVRFDNGELGNNRMVVDLFTRGGYNVQTTGPDSSDQNGKVERVHQDLGNGLRVLLHGANLENKFWPYAFHHYLHVYNMLPPADESRPSPLELVTGVKPDFGTLRTFGSRVYVRPPGQRKSKLHLHVNVGRFLGYARTQKVIIYRDDNTNTIKTARHVRFDEACNDMDNPPPHSKRLHQHLGENMASGHEDTEMVNLPDIDVTKETFLTLHTITVPITCDNELFGLEIAECSIRHRVYISRILKGSSISRLQHAQRRYTGAYIVQINHVVAFSIEDVHTAIREIRENPEKSDFILVLAPEPYVPPSRLKDKLPLHLGLNQLLSVHALRHSTMDGRADDLLSEECVMYEDTSAYKAIVYKELHGIANKVTHGTEEEQNLTRFTRARLKRLSTWEEWRKAEFEQLDAMAKQDMYGTPCLPPPGAIVLRQHWTYSFKADGRRKARNCCDGSARAAPQLRLNDTYSSCVEQPCVRLFLALVAHLGFIIYSTDATNAYANSPPPTQPTFVYIDDAYREWYHARHNIWLDQQLVLPVQHALQGHPESGKLWEQLIHARLTENMGLRSTTHERNLYVGTHKGHKILGCRQVDDLLFASNNPTILDTFINNLRATGIDLHTDGLTSSFNGVDILQTNTYIQLSCESYLRRFLKYHGWDTAGRGELSDQLCTPNSCPPKEPVSATELLKLQTTIGPTEDTPESINLSRRMGFGYRSVLGELMYAYVVGRFDIGYAITQLAKHAHAPAEGHYLALRRIAIYLRKTVNWGIIYWRSQPISTLIDGGFVRFRLSASDNLPPFPNIYDPFALHGFVDAAHATDLKTRRSISGYAFTLGGGVIAFRTKHQTTVATSSTEAEFIAAVFAAKVAKYLRSILTDLGFAPTGPTILYEDNEAVLHIINHRHPTERSRHIDVQFFAIQEWASRGDITMRPIVTTIQPADLLTKACGTTVHHRHACRLFGYLLADHPT